MTIELLDQQGRPPNASRIKYQNYVVNELLEKIDQRSKILTSNNTTSQDGDMLILTNERIEKEGESNLKYLTYYVSPIPSTTTVPDDYHETNSYINNLTSDDYIQYCLRIRRQTGQVSLIHAGVNDIYNPSPLECSFTKDKLNSTKLE
ncbi:unnamed protein product [Didymodactylos carnosus]|uniref:Uncharacterized protein n=1 Tax=Didymodactylos carnosus TaxID=1234261 RepID=A0A815VZQ4_9BILA|nr:unnamed protein product [Didymodactylos carnosus]CAF1538803.1 unnamed protein product [Didymodactylos carnosus]CAF4297862.1 unnamed protein product [Didymodactylos carnosus]CAF4398923.1 unnamed protein product [Didymodactylos carnosus]